MLLEHYIPEDTKEFESVYAVVESEGKTCMIAPLWIIKKTFRLLNQKGVYLLGRDSFSDYLNFVYQDFDADAFDFLLKDLSKRYGVKYCTFEDFRESTSAYNHILKNYHITRNSEYSCVTLDYHLRMRSIIKCLAKTSGRT